MNPWNLIGLAAWVLLVLYLIFIVMNIRSRHLKMLVTKKPSKLVTVCIDLAEVIVLLAGVYGMAYVSWLGPVDYTDKTAIKTKYDYTRLMLQTDSERSYYVAATSSGNGKQPIRYFTYWGDGVKYQVTSYHADVSDGAQPLTMRASAYPFKTKELAKWDKQTESAFVATFIGTYKATFYNGLGMHVGHNAQRFSLIRIPNDTFLKVQSVAGN